MDSPDNLDVLTEEAGRCCSSAFRKISLSGKLPEQSWECPRCGQEYRIRQVGEIGYYEAFVWSCKL